MKLQILAKKIVCITIKVANYLVPFLLVSHQVLDHPLLRSLLFFPVMQEQFEKQCKHNSHEEEHVSFGESYRLAFGSYSSRGRLGI